MRIRRNYPGRGGPAWGYPYIMVDVPEASAADTFIAVVDDNAQIRGVVVRALMNAGYSVRQWGDPGAAVADIAAAGNKVSLVVLDRVLPQMTGPQAASLIFEHNQNV